MESSENVGISHIIGSIISLLTVIILITTTIFPAIVTNSLITSDLVSNPRYGVTFPALETIEDMEDDSVIGIGSSILRAALDGKCVTETLVSDNVNVFNLAISGANPYTEILQIPAIIRANPKLVVLDMGPNNFWNFKENDESMNEYIRFRFTINSISMENSDIGNWTNLIRDIDKEWIAFNDLERTKLTQSYSQEAVEDWLKSMAIEYSEYIDYEKKYPLPGDPDWIEFLMSPHNFMHKNPYLEAKSPSEVNAYFEKNMPSKVRQGVYNPKLNDTLHHQSYEYMIKELTDAGIPILLLAAPHHPKVYDYLSEGQLDNFNSSFNHFLNYSDVYGLNLFWETWHESMFRDRNHLGVNGREYFCKRFAPILDDVMSDKENFTNILNEDIDLTNMLEEECDGNNFITNINKQIVYIEAESFSDCSLGEGIAFQDKWVFKNDLESSGSGYLHALPEDVSHYKSEILGARLDYNLSINHNDTYYVWVKMKGNSYGNDSIGLKWKSNVNSYSDLYKYDSFGWNSKGQWEWEPEFNQDILEFNASIGEKITISIWMREDGVMIDELIITNNKILNPNDDYHLYHNKPISCDGSDSIFIASENNEIFIEAEDYSNCKFGTGDASTHEWIEVEDQNSSGEIHLLAYPDIQAHYKDDLLGPSLSYEIFLPTNDTYFAWISVRPNSYGNDTIGMSWNNNGSTEEIMIMQTYAWNSKGQWEWEPQVTRVPLNLTLNESGISTLTIWMREDGIEFDRIIITSDEEFDPYKEEGGIEEIIISKTCKGSEYIFFASQFNEVSIEAEFFSSCNFGDSNDHEWIEVEDQNSSGEIHLLAYPDIQAHYKDDLLGPSLSYEIFLPTNDTYFAWISVRPNSYGNDTIGMSWNNNGSTEEIMIMQTYAWNSKGQWEWEPQVTRVPLNLTLNESGISTLTIWMREDGIEFDRIIITSDEEFDPYKEEGW